MISYVVDTNVAIVANGREKSAVGTREFSVECRRAAVDFIRRVFQPGVVCLDEGGEIQEEYRKHLRPDGQPGVGDRFYLEVINSHPSRIRRVRLNRDADGEYSILPKEVRESSFDLSDRKFAAVALIAEAVVVNASDSDWVHHQAMLDGAGVQVKNVCGSDDKAWFKADT